MRELSRLSGSARFRRWILAAALSALAPAVLSAQAGETDVGEVAASGGGTFGLGGAHPFAGGSIGIALSRNGIVLLEAAYTPTGKDRLWPRPDIKSPNDGRLFDCNTSVHIRFPVGERWAPYGILGAGLLWDSFNSLTGPQGAGIRVYDFKGAFHTGAGVRYYVKESWGIRPEVKVIVSNRTYTRLSIGIFYIIPPSLP